MENGPFIDGLPIKHVFFYSYVSLPEGIHLPWIEATLGKGWQWTPYPTPGTDSRWFEENMFKLGNLPVAAFPAEMGHNMGAFEDFAVPTLRQHWIDYIIYVHIYISINLGYWIDTMWCRLVFAYWFLSPTVDICTINRCYSMFWSLRYSSVGLWLGHLEIAVGVYIDGHIDLQIKRTTGINWLDRLSRNVVFLCSWRSFGEST